RSICPTSPMSARTESRPAWASRFRPMARRYVLPRAREQRSMADTAYVPRLRAEYDQKIRGQLTEKLGYANVMQVPRVRAEYAQKTRAQLTEKFGYANVMQVPRLDKIVLNMGVGEAVNDRKKAETAAADLSLIAGQKAIVTYSRVAIATFKLRENQPIGCKVTLRKAKMYEFIDRLGNGALPRGPDFRG